MIKFEHDGFRYFIRDHVGKGIMVQKCNLEVKPFVARWIVQKEEDTHELGAIEDHMSFWSVVGKGRCRCQLVLRFQERRNVDKP
jgi:hypothetical protein